MKKIAFLMATLILWVASFALAPNFNAYQAFRHSNIEDNATPKARNLYSIQSAIENQIQINEFSSTDPSDSFITNAHFLLTDIVVGGVSLWDYDCATNGIAATNYSMLPIEGWTRMTTDNGTASGVFGIGTSAFLGGTGFLPPTTMSDGSAEGKVLGLVTCWSMTVQYTQPVSLPAGHYSLSISYYNSGGSQAIDKNLIGFIADDGNEYLFQQKTFKVGQWLKESIEFELDKETTGYFSLGYKSTNSASYNMPHIFVDGISLTYAGIGINPEPYAVLSNNNTVLTFYYDNQKEARGGMSVGPFNNANDRGWDANKESITSVVFDASFANCTSLTSTAYWFYQCTNLTSITGIANLKTDNVTNMHWMFLGCSNLTSLDVSGFNTENVTDMNSLFFYCSGLTSLDVSGFKTDRVKDMNGMFEGCSNLTSLDVSGFNTENVTDMGLMFSVCSGLTTLDVSGFNTENVTDMHWMFQLCTGLTSLDLSSFKTDNVTDMGGMFQDCSGLTSLDLSSFKTNNAMSMYHMFRDCSGLITIVVNNGWSTAKVTDSAYMFSGCTKLVGGRGTKYNANHIDAAYAHIDGGATNPGYFTDKNAATDPEPYAVLSNYNTVLTFYYDNQKEARGGMSIGPFNNANERGWDSVASAITNVVFDASFADYTSLTNTRYWFAFCPNLTSITGISNLKTENVTDMGCMFEGCRGLKSIDLSSFKTDNAMYLDMMFYGCSGLGSLDLSGFNTEKVIDMGAMFMGCSGLTSLDLSSFKTNNVMGMDYMFQNCSALTTIVVDNGWSTAKVTNSAYMFAGCTKLVGGRGTKYNANHIDAAYAHIDGGTSNPGYFTDKNAAAICETPQIQRDGTSNSIIMTCSTAGASIYYTTNGTTPTENNTRYTGPVEVSHNCIIKAIAVKDGYESSGVASYNVNWFKVATPTFSYNNLKLTISTTTEGATIYYTTDGSTPSTTNTKAQVYSSPISLTGNTTVKAIAVKADFTNSDVATYKFVIDNYTCQAPQISRSGSTNSIIMTSATSGATIYYTTDGTTPTNGSTRFNGPFTVDHNQTIRAIAMKDGMFNSAQSQFTVDWFKVATPTFSYSNLQLTISTTTTGATIYYTTNDSNPLDDLSKAIRYTTPIRMEANAVIKAVGVKTDFSNSEVVSYTFVKADYTCKQPLIQRDGTSNRLTMSCEDANAVIYYTTDGSTPTTSSTRYTGPIMVAYNCTVRAIATRSDLFPSDVTEFKVDWLTASSVEVAYNNGVLTLSCTTSGAEIHYEIGGKDATKSSPLYTNPIPLTDNREVRFVAYAEGYDPVSGSFTPTDFTCAPVTLSYDGLNIELATTEEGATIYYTTDGSLPTTASNTYRGKISLKGLCTVNAFATKQYKNNSEMMSEPITYFFDGTDVFLSEAGRLGDAVKREIEDIETLNVKCQGSGELNASDFSALRSIKSLKHLNLQDALFENNTVPDGAFANMNVVSIEFPPTETKISRITGNVFSGSNHLAAIVWMAPIKMAQSASALGITNPNLLIYVDNKSFAPQGVRNIVENGSASSIVLTDEGISFWCPQAFTAQRISYTHIYSQTTGINKCSGWETIALPFDVQNITHEDMGRIAPFAAGDATARSFWLGELSESGFKRASEIKAYTPYIISMPNNEVYGNSYILAGSVTFEAYNTTVPVTEIKTTKKGTHVFTPCFDVVNAASSVYAINKYDQSNSYPEGSTFLPNYSDVKPFEAYISVPTNGVAPRYIPIRDDSDTGIENLTQSLSQGKEAAYDLTGRKVQGELQRGVYIINGKKVMVK